MYICENSNMVIISLLLVTLTLGCTDVNLQVTKPTVYKFAYKWKTAKKT